jgi:hypothetical protein
MTRGAGGGGGEVGGGGVRVGAREEAVVLCGKGGWTVATAAAHQLLHAPCFQC